MTIGKSLLGDQQSNCEEDLKGECATTTTSDPGALEIQASASSIAAPIEGADQVEITGSCKDLGRKNNRILVEVYAAEDESSSAYINNTISDVCYPATNPVRSGLESVFINPKSLVLGVSQGYTFTATGGTGPYVYSIVLGSGAINPGTGVYTSGVATGTDIIQVTDANGEVSRSIVTVLSGITTAVPAVDSKKCLTVTKGIGLVEDAGLPNERTYPQCHNGQFGFSIRLGKVLVNPVAGQTNYKYMVRYKIRTQEGAIQDSPWSKISIERNLTTPLITSAAYDPTTHKCTIQSSPARFNLGILYTLNRTFTDIAATNAGSTNLYSNANTLGVTTGTSVFNWDDSGLTDGVTYNYTLASLEANYGYASPLTLSSTVVSCAARQMSIKISNPAVSGTCYLSLNDTGPLATTANPLAYVDNLANPPHKIIEYEWGYSNTNAAWVGSDYKAPLPPTLSSCTDAICTQPGLAVGNYFFSLRAKNTVTGELGIWSPVVLCAVPN